MALTQAEYDYLMGQDKEFDDLSATIQLGPPPINWTRKVISPATREQFLLDFHRGSIELSKFTVNKRYRQTIILIRYDNGGRHTNPDGDSFAGPHVHLYREGYDDKFAFPVSTIGVVASDDMAAVLSKVLVYCNIKNIPVIEPPLF